MSEDLLPFEAPESLRAEGWAIAGCVIRSTCQGIIGKTQNNVDNCAAY